MTIQKSFVLPATFPGSKKNVDELKKALEWIDPFDFSVVEFYSADGNPRSIRELLGKRRGVFLAAALQKERNLSLCTAESAERRKAVDSLAECFLFACQAGAESVLINSGTRPEDEKSDPDCLNYLRDSICELHRRVSGIGILLEPGDRDVEYRHLIGGTDMAVSFVEDIRTDVPCIGLVFDTSHIAQLNEELYSSWKLAKKYCSHIHLANCVLDKSSPLYGDKHPLFSQDAGVFSHESIRRFYQSLQNETQPLTVGIEVICREDSEQNFFQRLVAETGWFFAKEW